LKKKLNYEICDLNKLEEGDNKNSICNLSCVKQIENELTSRTLICIDSSTNIVALVIHNLSPKFAPLIGDTFTIIRPFLTKVQNLEVSGDILNFPLFKIADPDKQLLRNGRQLKIEQLGSTSINIRMSVSDDSSTNSQ